MCELASTGVFFSPGVPTKQKKRKERKMHGWVFFTIFCLSFFAIATNGQVLVTKSYQNANCTGPVTQVQLSPVCTREGNGTKLASVIGGAVNTYRCTGMSCSGVCTIMDTATNATCRSSRNTITYISMYVPIVEGLNAHLMMGPAPNTSCFNSTIIRQMPITPRNACTKIDGALVQTTCDQNVLSVLLCNTNCSNCNPISNLFDNCTKASGFCLSSNQGYQFNNTVAGATIQNQAFNFVLAPVS